MKLLVVLSSDNIFNRISACVRPLGFELIRYYHVLKAMDNIDEIDPQAIIISAVDFPRHWKTMVQFFREERKKEDCPILLLKGKNFAIEDSSKASFLGVSGIIDESLHNQEIDRLQNILGRHLPVEEKRRSRRLYVQPWQKFSFIFSHPERETLIPGQVRDVSTGGISFQPESHSHIGSIGLHTRLDHCSFRAGDYILSPVCRLARTGRIVSLEFVSFPDGEQQALNECIEKLLHGELENA